MSREEKKDRHRSERSDRGDRDRSDRRKDERGDRGDRDRGDRGEKEKDRGERDRRSRSRSGGKKHKRSRRSRSRSRSDSSGRKKKKKSGWDQPPTDGSMIGVIPGLPGVTINPSLASVHPSRLGQVGDGGGSGGSGIMQLGPAPPAIIAPPSRPGLPITSPAQLGQVQQLQATRQARRLYVGNLPSDTREEELRLFFCHAMAAANPGAPPGDAVLSVYLNLEKKFGFVEFRTIEEATAAMALDGITFRGDRFLKVRRPSDYSATMFPPTTQSKPVPKLDLTKLGIVSTQVPDGPAKVFCGGLPYDLSEGEVKELLSSFGHLKSFHLVKDRDVSTSKGYCFFEYTDPSITDTAIQGLNGIQIGSKTLTVRRAQPREDMIGGMGGMGGMGMGGMGGMGTLPGGIAVGMGGMNMAGINSLIQGMPQFNTPQMQGLGMAPPAAAATRVLVLKNMVVPEELVNDQEYKEILEDITMECGKSGTVRSVFVPRPAPPGTVVAGLGKVFVEFSAPEEAARARAEVEGRQFANRTVLADYLDEQKFAARQLE